MPATFETQFGEKNSLDMCAYYLAEAAKCLNDRYSDDTVQGLLLATAAIASRRPGETLRLIRVIVSDETAMSEGFTYCMLQAYACSFIATQRIADRVLSTTGTSQPLAEPMPYPFVGDRAASDIDSSDVANYETEI